MKLTEQDKKDFTLAHKFLQMAKNERELLEDQAGVGLALNNIASVHRDQGDSARVQGNNVYARIKSL